MYDLSTLNKINYCSFTLLHRIYSHIHWVFLMCLVRFILTLWLIQNLAKITTKTHTFFKASIYIYSENMWHSGWKAEAQLLHPDVAKFCYIKKAKFYTYKDVSAKILKSALIPQCKTFWFNTAAIEILKMALRVTETFIIASE